MVSKKKTVTGSESDAAVVADEAANAVDETSDAFLLGNIALQ